MTTCSPRDPLDERARTHLIFGSDPICFSVTGCDKDDFTLYVEEAAFRGALRAALALSALKEDEQQHMLQVLAQGKSFDIQHDVQFSDGVRRSGRIHAALCFGRRSFSVTFRSLTAEDGSPDLPKLSTRWEQCPADGVSVWSDPPSNQNKAREKGFLFTFETVSKHISESILGSNAEDTELDGLILFAGATATGKTQYLNGTVAHVLKQLVERKGRREANKQSERIPHVVAVGDPVETMLFGKNLEHARDQLMATQDFRCVDFTARVLGIDVASVADAIRDAKRETPSIFIISELRESADFVAALDLATTGHLVLATSHNTSLTDAMEKLTHELKADTASARSSLAQLIRAVVHVSRFETSPYDLEPVRAILPAIWRRRPSGVQAFVSDGLSSVLTHTFEDKNDRDLSCLGYTHALRRLWSSSLGEKNRSQYAELRRQTLLKDLNLVSGTTDAALRNT
jgi:hypothetical protein